MLRIARMDAGLKQQDVATALTVRLGRKVSRPLVSKWERNKAVPDIEEWRELVLLFEEYGPSDLRSLLSAWLTAVEAQAA